MRHTLYQRRERLGEDHLAAAESEWPSLIAAVPAEKDAGTDPAEASPALEQGQLRQRFRADAAFETLRRRTRGGTRT